MTKDGTHLFDEFARFVGDAASVAQGFQREAETFFRSQAERIIGELDLVRREDFEAVKELASKARIENERLGARVAALEAKLGSTTGKAKPEASRPAAGSKAKRKSG
ncbi:MAG: accessory factor UbiK family protein [Bauldia sp.]